MPRPKSPPKKKTTSKRKPAMKKAEIVKIAKSAVSAVAEKKYMNPELFRGETPAKIIGNNRISVLGFCTMTSQTENNSVIMYGDTEVKGIKALRHFPYASPTNPTAVFSNNAIVGKECRPVSSRTHIRMTRNAANLTTLALGDLGDYNDNPPEGGPPTGSDLATMGLVQACPVMCRMIRVIPKISPNTRTEISPNDDLFLNETGDPTGVATKSDGTVFYENDLLTYKVNNRRYTVLQDSKFVLQNPLSITYQWTQSVGQGANDHGGWWAPLVSNGSSNCQKSMNIYHQLTQKKHGSVRYEDPANAEIDPEVSQPVSGHRREYIFFHWFYLGADSLPRTPDDNANSAPMDITLDLRNITKFTDV